MQNLKFSYLALFGYHINSDLFKQTIKGSSIKDVVVKRERGQGPSEGLKIRGVGMY